jgi:hypothetical protein
MKNLLGEDVEEVVHDDSAEVKRNLADALAFWTRMESSHGKDSVIAVRAKEGYYKMKKEAGL